MKHIIITAMLCAGLFTTTVFASSSFTKVDSIFPGIKFKAIEPDSTAPISLKFDRRTDGANLRRDRSVNYLPARGQDLGIISLVDTIPVDTAEFHEFKTTLDSNELAIVNQVLLGLEHGTGDMGISGLENYLFDWAEERAPATQKILKGTIRRLYLCYIFEGQVFMARVNMQDKEEPVGYYFLNLKDRQ